MTISADSEATAVRLSLDQVNPTRDAFSVIVNTVGLDGGQIRLGSLAPFPVGSSGLFVVGLQRERMAAASGAGWQLELVLEPIAPGESLSERLQVTLSGFELVH